MEAIDKNHCTVSKKATTPQQPAELFPDFIFSRLQRQTPVFFIVL